MIQQHQLQNPITQEEINGVIEKDAKLKREITQLSNSECDCENVNEINWLFLFTIILMITICAILFILLIPCLILETIRDDAPFAESIETILGFMALLFC